jgi:hypothetical protein
MTSATRRLLPYHAVPYLYPGARARRSRSDWYSACAAGKATYSSGRSPAGGSTNTAQQEGASTWSRDSTDGFAGAVSGFSWA